MSAFGLASLVLGGPMHRISIPGKKDVVVDIIRNIFDEVEIEGAK